ncbi:hypothetical protein T265_08053 [Opisthorchis viverrini]|uniref:Uncharacterized protein n=1 Tax=Opisthorchis viverrini TaxID=6198 RepID=A0A074ZLM6_OPIVI|nr:hypothetical protein T265_08053 [Opisthorchis viverrini]KER24260.1 hypothetical protein T265_08053 [Opisthorchis viverrini]
MTLKFIHYEEKSNGKNTAMGTSLWVDGGGSACLLGFGVLRNSAVLLDIKLADGQKIRMNAMSAYVLLELGNSPGSSTFSVKNTIEANSCRYILEKQAQYQNVTLCPEVDLSCLISVVFVCIEAYKMTSSGNGGAFFHAEVRYYHMACPSQESGPISADVDVPMDDSCQGTNPSKNQTRLPPLRSSEVQRCMGEIDFVSRTGQPRDGQDNEEEYKRPNQIVLAVLCNLLLLLPSFTEQRQVANW